MEEQIKEILAKYGADIDYQGWEDGDIETATQAILTLINESNLGVLDEIVRGNYAPDLGTYDYDGIADAVFVHIEQLRLQNSKDGKE